jgi:hypothetical protein
MSETTDPRITNQKKFLFGVVLKKRTWSRQAPEWDHDHCAFCWAKFSDVDDVDALHEGYATSDMDHWVCTTCFADFRTHFQWLIKY